MNDIPEHLEQPLIDLLLALADDKLMQGHRNSDWTGLAPILEEDIAFSSLAQDEMAHASALYDLVSPLANRSPDELAFGRSPDAYRCAALVELADEFDWATAIARQFYCDHFDYLRLRRLARSRHAELAALCRRLYAEEQVHVEHVDGWIRRLGQGTEESRNRLQVALHALAPHASLLLEAVDGQAELEKAGLYPVDADQPDMFQSWSNTLRAVAESARLELTLEPPDPAARGGRRGQHLPEFPALLEEMCEVYRLEPGAAW